HPYALGCNGARRARFNDPTLTPSPFSGDGRPLCHPRGLCQPSFMAVRAPAFARKKSCGTRLRNPLVVDGDREACAHSYRAVCLGVGGGICKGVLGMPSRLLPMVMK